MHDPIVELNKWADVPFCNVLKGIELADKAQCYDDRNDLVMLLVTMARERGLSAGYRIDLKEPEWPVAFIELPTGQVSWHLPQHTKEWDGHSTEDKYKRAKAFIDAEECKPIFQWGEITNAQHNP